MQELQLYDIYEYWHVPFWQTKFFYMLCALLLIIACLVLLYIFWNIFRKQKKLTPEQYALSELAQLKKQSIITREQAQEVYSKLTETLKRYFEFYFNKPFITFSDKQVIDALEKEPLLTSYHSEFKELFEAGMFVKFAQENALREQVMKHIDLSTLLINHLARAHKNS